MKAVREKRVTSGGQRWDPLLKMGMGMDMMIEETSN